MRRFRIINRVAKFIAYLMTKRFLPVNLKPLCAVLAILFVSFTALAQESQPFSINTSPLPEPTGFVNDYAGVIDAATKQQLEAKLKNLKETTTPPVEIAVAVVKTTGERPIFEYSLAVARGWKIGSKEDDNPSALLMVAVDDRKFFTQISKDLEDELPDGVVGGLQRQFLVPEFRQGNYGKGISDTLDAYIAAIRNKTGPATAAPQKPAAGTKTAGGLSLSSIFCCGIIILVILVLIFSRSKKGKNDDDDDGWGGGAASALPWVIGSIIANSGSSSGSSGGWGGGDSGGGSDWGGFGGGGDFGGGGGGGDW